MRTHQILCEIGAITNNTLSKRIYSFEACNNKWTPLQKPNIWLYVGDIKNLTDIRPLQVVNRIGTEFVRNNYEKLHNLFIIHWKNWKTKRDKSKFSNTMCTNTSFQTPRWDFCYCILLSREEPTCTANAAARWPSASLRVHHSTATEATKSRIHWKHWA